MYHSFRTDAAASSNVCVAVTVLPSLLLLLRHQVFCWVCVRYVLVYSYAHCTCLLYVHIVFVDAHIRLSVFLMCLVLQSTVMTTNDIVIHKLTQVLSYLRGSRHDRKKMKRKDKGKKAE